MLCEYCLFRARERDSNDSARRAGQHGGSSVLRQAAGRHTLVLRPVREPATRRAKRRRDTAGPVRSVRECGGDSGQRDHNKPQVSDGSEF